MTSLYIFGRRRPLPVRFLRGNHLLDVILFAIWAGMNGGVFYWQWCLMPMETLERVIRVLGHIIQLNLGLILFPITRQSVWLLILGMSFEKAAKYHRFLGRVVVMVMTAHLVGWYVRWAINTEDGSLDASDSDSFDYAGTTPTGRIWHWQLKPVTLYGEGAYFCAILILATSWRMLVPFLPSLPSFPRAFLLSLPSDVPAVFVMLPSKSFTTLTI
jgi:hypothetical protein